MNGWSLMEQGTAKGKIISEPRFYKESLAERLCLGQDSESHETLIAQCFRVNDLNNLQNLSTRGTRCTGGKGSQPRFSLFIAMLGEYLGGSVFSQCLRMSDTQCWAQDEREGIKRISEHPTSSPTLRLYLCSICIFKLACVRRAGAEQKYD